MPDGTKAEIIDLPGTYSLYPRSLDERVVFDILIDEDGRYYVRVEDTISKCVSRDTLIVKQDTLIPVAEIEGDSVQGCEGDTLWIELTGLDSSRTFNVEWSTDDGLIIQSIQFIRTINCYSCNWFFNIE